MLIVMCGMPGTGKSAVASGLAEALDAALYAVDPIENAILGSGFKRNEETGLAAYRIAEVLVEDSLRAKRSVIVDAVNAKTFVRDGWIDIAARNETQTLFIGTICSNPELHQQRLESRRRNMVPSMDVTWQMVQNRQLEFDAFPDGALVLDSIHPLHENVRWAMEWLREVRV